ncbi:hypothetical protein Ddye_015078 [Dipteronia dyeriana]|uniref:ATPase AAA-type core domain-containing protein n=1 Tax=Dipteronia dyeriana TaxID=168575 RepID=A0AAD9U4Q4_9ROSI|nr:hypothetical protein Ddye_015078 [Dipteronia dyeriana]
MTCERERKGERKRFSDEKRSFKLSFHKRHRELITRPYIEHVMSKGKAVSTKNRQRKLYNNNPSKNWYGWKKTNWSHVFFEHPSTFDTLAMETKKNEEIKNDLKKFQLRNLLIETSSKSVIVIEDIDCSLDLTGQRMKKKEKDGDGEETDPIKKKENEESENKVSKVTLSGLLNFIDGLWSTCGGERITVFTMNHVDKLDPALIRRGRMDKHIKMSYCCFEAFKVLAKNYLDINSHDLYAKVECLLGETNMTPADVAENLMPKSDEEGLETCLNSLIEALDEVKEEARKKADEEVRLKAEKEENDKEYIAHKGVKVDENPANSVVKENGFHK